MSRAEDRAPSWQMLRLLHNVAAGRPVTFGVRGQSAHGGLEGTMAACRRRGWIVTTRDKSGEVHLLTPAGAVIELGSR